MDPASCAFAQRVVQADVFYTKEDDGLKQPWRGKVFLNPPFSFPAIAHFVEKLCAGIASGDVACAILLTNNNTYTKWWHLAARHAEAVCFTAGRINFYKADGAKAQPTNGQTFFYFGPDVFRFYRMFGKIGEILVHRARSADD